MSAPIYLTSFTRGVGALPWTFTKLLRQRDEKNFGAVTALGNNTSAPFNNVAAEISAS
jgi:hypothetical protein